MAVMLAAIDFCERRMAGMRRFALSAQAARRIISVC